MTPEEERNIIAAWSKNALKLMTQNQISFLPENYAIWFEYTRGNNKRLKEAIDKILGEKKPFTHDINHYLYSTYIVKDLDARTVADASTRVQRIMSNVLKMVESSSQNTESYNAELDSFSDELQSSDVPSAMEFKSTILRLLERTKDLKEKGENLNDKLNQSRKEVEILKTNLEEVSLQVSMDALTGIANRKALDEMLLQHIREAKDTSHSLSLLMLDVDHFKKFNDTYGHLLGDQVLRIVASCMKDVVKGRDFVARYGGEEFVVILPDTPLRGAEIVAENIRKTIASRELKRKDTGESYGSVTVSIGIAVLNHRYDKPDDLIARADKGLYLSKKNGRNQVTTAE